MPVVETALYTRDGLWIFCEYLQDLLVSYEEQTTFFD